MNLPVEGAIVEASAADSLLVRFPAVSAADISPTYAAMRQALVDAGWEPLRETVTTDSRQLNLTTPDGRRAKLGVLIDADRPLAQITVLP